MDEIAENTERVKVSELRNGDKVLQEVDGKLEAFPISITIDEQTKRRTVWVLLPEEAKELREEELTLRLRR